ncbi:cation diffusion facilitator family transporter [Labilithrix luteola]|nr:cation diffusion facilitator family transporter [Labilithrix luteola]
MPATLMRAKVNVFGMAPHDHQHDAHQDEHGHAQHGHAHGHGHGHAHAHAAAATGRAFAIGVGLNVAFVVVELVAGVFSESVALVADAAHNFGDVLGLGLAWGAAYLAKRKPSERRTYGLRRTTILASLANAILLLVGVGGVSWEAIGRLRDAPSVNGVVVLAVAAAGVVVNGGSALLFLHGRERDANVRGAFLHLMADAAVSLGVVVAGIVILATGLRWVDPVVSLLVSLAILVSTWSLLRDSLDLALDAVPQGIDPNAVETFLEELPGVVEVHDLHIWAMSTTETALTAHLVMVDGACHDAFLRDVGRELTRRFQIHHPTLQVEPPDAPEECAHACDDVL